MEDFKVRKAKILKSKRLFEDPDFPADSRALYFSGDGSPSISWKRPREITPNARFLVSGASYYDMQQGELGNCWFVAGAVTLAASNWKLFERVVPLNQEFDSSYAGIFRFRFWQYGKWIEVIVDDLLPTRYGELIYTANRKEKNEFWCPLLEKAYAKLYGCYEAIDGGRISQALVDMTGGISEFIELNNEMALEKLQSTLLTCKKMNTLMGGAIFSRPGATSRETQRHNGLYEGHAYSIVDIKEVHIRGQKKMLIRLRNPWGKGEWNGAWSDGSPEWRHLRHSDSVAVDHSNIPNGEFWMELEDFQENFDQVEMCHLCPDALSSEIASEQKKKQWLIQEFHGSWIRGVTSGGPLKSFTSKLFWKNPQYKVHLDKSEKPISVIVSLMEVSDRRVRDESDVVIGFVMFRLQEGRDVERLSGDNFYDFMPRLEKTSGIFWPYRERTMHFELNPGIYIVVPCTLKPSMEAEFYLRVMSEEPSKITPVETPTGPIHEDTDFTKSSLELLYGKYCGSDGRVDAVGLRHILSELKHEESGSNEGFTLETCRCLVALRDFKMEGTLDFPKVQQCWELINICAKAFASFDTDETNSMDVYELGELYKKVGFSLSVDIRKALVRRYGGRDGKIQEEDFIQSLCKVLTLHKKFKDYNKGGYITMDLSKFEGNVCLGAMSFLTEPKATLAHIELD